MPDTTVAGSIESTASTIDAPARPVTVHLPAGLSARTAGKRTFLVTGATLRDVVDALDLACPGLRFDLCQETGDLRQFVNVFVGGRNVRHLHGLATLIPAGVTIHILPSVAGG